MKYRLMLPGVNVAAAVCAAVLDDIHPSYGPPSPLLLATYLINAPVVLVRTFSESALERLLRAIYSPDNGAAFLRLERVVYQVIFASTVAILWYLVGWVIDSGSLWHKEAVPNIDRNHPTVDLILIAAGLVCGLMAVLNWRERIFPLRMPLPSIAYGTWALVLLILGGCDLSRGTLSSSSVAKDGS